LTRINAAVINVDLTAMPSESWSTGTRKRVHSILTCSTIEAGTRSTNIIVYFTIHSIVTRRTNAAIRVNPV